MKKNAFKSFSITVQGRLVEFNRPAVMGILNVTDDSFYDGGRYREPEAMLAQARKRLDDLNPNNCVNNSNQANDNIEIQEDERQITQIVKRARLTESRFAPEVKSHKIFIECGE